MYNSKKSTLNSPVISSSSPSPTTIGNVSIKSLNPSYSGTSSRAHSYTYKKKNLQTLQNKKATKCPRIVITSGGLPIKHIGQVMYILIYVFITRFPKECRVFYRCPIKVFKTIQTLQLTAVLTSKSSRCRAKLKP